jgi:L-threonylcarbamoyladenylate synthase
MEEVKDKKEIISRIKDGEVGIMPTDTIYGLVCAANNRDSIERIYEIKKRDLAKPCVFLVSGYEDLEKIGIGVDSEIKNKMGDHWPGPVSFELPCSDEFDYLHRGKGTVAVRLPDNNELVSIISETGPVVATSVNIEGQPAAKSIEDVRASEIETDSIDFYVDAGKIELMAPSRIIRFNSSREEEIIR